MEAGLRANADGVRARVQMGEAPPAVFRSALMSVPPVVRDRWVDRVIGISELADDGPALPRDCAPYLPCSVDAILRAIDIADIKSSDIFVDIGAGVGRAGLLVRLLTGASVIGIEIQPALAAAARCYAQQLNVPGVSIVEGDAVELTGYIAIGTVFFLYCPFSGDRLTEVVNGIEPIARTRPLRICSVDVQLPCRPWLSPVIEDSPDLVVCASNLHPPFAAQPAHPTRALEANQ